MDTKKLELRESALFSYIFKFAEKLEKDEGIELLINPDVAAKNIAALYFRYSEEVVKPTIKSGVIQNYKIVGYTELTVMRVSPVELKNGDTKHALSLNAQLALNIALGILIDWNMIDPEKFTQLVNTDAEIRSFLEEHVLWLRNLDTRYYFPGFSNAQVWKLFHYLVTDRIKHL